MRHVPRKIGPALRHSSKNFWIGKRSYYKGRKIRFVADQKTVGEPHHIQATQERKCEPVIIIIFFCPANLSCEYNDY